MPRGVAQFEIKNHLPSPSPPIWKWMVKNAGKNHALINRNYVRSRGRALAPLKLRSTSWPQLEQARVNKANARRDLDRKKWKKTDQVKSSQITCLWTGKCRNDLPCIIATWFPVIPPAPVALPDPACLPACLRGHVPISTSLCPLLGQQLWRIKNERQNETENGAPLDQKTKKKAKEKLKFHFRLAPVLCCCF